MSEMTLVVRSKGKPMALTPMSAWTVSKADRGIV